MHSRPYIHVDEHWKIVRINYNEFTYELFALPSTNVISQYIKIEDIDFPQFKYNLDKVTNMFKNCFIYSELCGVKYIKRSKFWCLIAIICYENQHIAFSFNQQNVYKIHLIFQYTHKAISLNVSTLLKLEQSDVSFSNSEKNNLLPFIKFIYNKNLKLNLNIKHEIMLQKLLYENI